MKDAIIIVAATIYLGIGLGIASTAKNFNERCGDGEFTNISFAGLSMTWPIVLVGAGTASVLGWESTTEWRC